MLERKGVQTVAVLTHTFRRPGDAMARVQGFVNYRYAVISHPISNLREQQIRECAQSAVPEVLAVLGIEE
jgi:hypothetical protein